jgi:hypothetical protein
VSSTGAKWRTGSFSGTSALAISQSDGFTYIFLTNTSPWLGARFPYEVNRMMATALHRVEEWPEINLFNPIAYNENFVEKYSSVQATIDWKELCDFSWIRKVS